MDRCWSSHPSYQSQTYPQTRETQRRLRARTWCRLSARAVAPARPRGDQPRTHRPEPQAQRPCMAPPDGAPPHTSPGLDGSTGWSSCACGRPARPCRCQPPASILGRRWGPGSGRQSTPAGPHPPLAARPAAVRPNEVQSGPSPFTPCSTRPKRKWDSYSSRLIWLAPLRPCRYQREACLPPRASLA
jgi:hypothetical protein